MAQCKECLHYGVCAKEGRLVQVDEHTWDEYNLLPNVEQFCTSYFTADVVPKSEVEQIFDDIERLMFATKIGTLHGFYYSTDLKYCVAELKKKYTESEDKV